LETTRKVCDAVGIPVIVSGGAGSAEHVMEGIRDGGAAAAAAASIFHFTEITPLTVKNHLSAHGIAVRKTG